MYSYCCSNLYVIYGKGLLTQDYNDNKVLLKKTAPKRSLKRNTVMPKNINLGNILIHGRYTTICILLLSLGFSKRKKVRNL